MFEFLTSVIWQGLGIALAVMLTVLMITFTMVIYGKKKTGAPAPAQATGSAATAGAAPATPVTATSDKKGKSWWKLSLGKILMIAVICFFAFPVVMIILATILELAHPSNRVEKQVTIVSKSLAAPPNALELCITSTEQTVPPAARGKRWHLETKDNSAILEYQAFKISPDGTKRVVGKWQCDGTAGTRIDFPTADEYLVRVANKERTKVLWWED